MERVIKTALNEADRKAGKIVTTKAVIDWADVTAEEMQKLAASSVAIDQQSIWRASGSIPAECVIKVRELIDSPKGGGFKPTPENMAARIGKQTDEDYAKTLRILGLSEKQVETMVKARAKQ